MIIGFEKTYKIFLLWIFFSLLSFAFSEEWKSELYPEDWKPGYIKDKLFFLQDYSYAGYKNAIYKSKKYPAKKVIVTDYGADSTGEKDSSEAFSKAVNAATHYKGAEIFIPPGKYLLTKPIKIFHNNIVLRGAGKSKTKLRFSGSFPANIFFSGKGQHRTEIKLLKDTEIFSKQIFPEHTDGLEKGMDIDIGIVITESFIHDHQMGKYWKFAKNKWRTFFRREIKTVDHKNNSVTFEVPIRYSLKCRDNLSLKIVDGYLSECGIENLSVCNATDKKNAWKYDRRHVIEFRSVKDCWVSGVDSFPSAVIEQKGMHLQSGGIIIRRSKKMTVSDCDFNNPQNRGGGGNGYLFEISQSCEILTKDCRAENGRHNFIQNWDFNTNGCVWLRVNSSGSRAFKGSWDPIGFPAASEFHHALAMANLIDNCVINDEWKAVNRGHWSSGAGHTSTMNVFWNSKGKGSLTSAQYEIGYVIGTSKSLNVKKKKFFLFNFKGDESQDYFEGIGLAKNLVPQSLYLSQLKRRKKIDNIK